MEEQYLKAVADIKSVDLRAIMDAYGEDVWNYAYFLTKKRDVADDISQEVFIKVYRSFSSFRGESSLKTWLLKLTRNTAFSYRRLAFFRKTTLMDFIPFTANYPSAEAEFLERSLTDELWKHVLALPTPYRETLVLHTHYHLSMEEVGQTLGVSVGTVKSRLHRARAKLSAAMGRGVSHE